ncbi:hypothetical protein THRCLA_05777 [Thraustotheca clavata]|uniref:Kinetochore protein SPC25 n=1 Tax=Thraustotheca clavata TaxID=74557 RepID=A0A1V9ZSW6_9STRA|nr:hypothetical protein THRCLA_05777 [Thraustotheca clavata]
MELLELPLDEHLEAVEKAIGEWTEQQKRRCKSAQRTSSVEVAKSEEELRELQKQKLELLEAIKQAEVAREQQKRRIAANENETRDLQAEIMKAEPIITSLKSRENLHQGNLGNLNQESNKSAQAHAQVVDELMKGISLYQKLGLLIDKKRENNLAFIFTQLDPNNPNREFSFSLRIEDNPDVFLVENCVPEVSDVNELLDQLNKTGNISTFVRAMRLRFKNLV